MPRRAIAVLVVPSPALTEASPPRLSPPRLSPPRLSPPRLSPPRLSPPRDESRSRAKGKKECSPTKRVHQALTQPHMARSSRLAHRMVMLLPSLVQVRRVLAHLLMCPMHAPRVSLTPLSALMIPNGMRGVVWDNWELATSTCDVESRISAVPEQRLRRGFSRHIAGRGARTGKFEEAF
jgi:hypothetical protein